MPADENAKDATVRLPKTKGCGLSWLFSRECPSHGRGCPWHALWRRHRQEREDAPKEPGR